MRHEDVQQLVALGGTQAAAFKQRGSLEHSFVLGKQGRTHQWRAFTVQAGGHHRIGSPDTQASPHKDVGVNHCKHGVMVANLPPDEAVIKRYGMVTMCVGMGQGAAGIFERV
ncbi:hypothetical protein GCM10028785_16150 [Hydrogenophaga soli]